jgi:hypothetical protein
MHYVGTCVARFWRARRRHACAIKSGMSKSRKLPSAPGGGKQEKPPYAMPCPGCMRLIDARVRLCPYCGVDTVKKLMPARMIFTVLVVLLVMGIFGAIRYCVGG